MPIEKMKNPYKGSGQITREQFLFYEMRTTARLLIEGLDEKELIAKIVEYNLFQYPTEKSVKSMAKTCMKRLKALDNNELVEAIAVKYTDAAKQICLYAMMKQYRLVWDFMINVIGEKYRLKDYNFGQMDVNIFLIQLQEQNDYVAGWSDTTMKRIRQVMIRILIENGYLDDNKVDHINPVWIDPILENAIKNKGDVRALTAFNCFS